MGKIAPLLEKIMLDHIQVVVRTTNTLKSFNQWLILKWICQSTVKIVTSSGLYVDQ